MPQEFRRHTPRENVISDCELFDLRSNSDEDDISGELKKGYRAVLLSIGGFDFYYFFDDIYLTKMEQCIALFLMQQLKRDEIATILFLSPATVRTHVVTIYSKLSAYSDYKINRPAHVQKFFADRRKLVLVSEYKRIPARSAFSEVELEIIELLRKKWEPELISAYLHIDIDSLTTILGSLIKKLTEVGSFEEWK